MYKSHYFYNMMNLNKYIQMNNEMMVANMTRAIVQDSTDVNLVLDSQNYNDIPKHFRKSTDTLNTQNNSGLNLNGLNTLNISGSQQFSEYNLPLIIESIGNSLPITVIDLRQESHGFINGAPVSWANTRNDANIGLTKAEVLIDEYNKLSSIKLNVPITYYNHKNITIVPEKVEDEEHLVTSKSLSYIRIPVTDGKIPTDDMVDYFVELVKLQPKDTWLHFHCKQGIGRTSTFMIMYDMIKNSMDVTADDIIKRQLLLANFDESHIKSFSNNERITFLQDFYKYCKVNINGKY
jgi:protein-tyrosine phosphatase